MEIKIFDNLILTTDSPVSSYGIPALRHLGCNCADYGPGDPVPRCLDEEEGDANMAAMLCRVIDWMGIPDDTAELRAAIRQWLGQLPGGPELPEGQ